MRSTLLLVNGIPGTGKTTLSRKLGHDLGMPCIGKDDIKEMLFERLGVGDLSWSKDLGVAAVEALFVLAERFAVSGRDAILENAFYYSFAFPRLESLLHDGVNILEVYCKTQPSIWKDRFESRVSSPERHPGHLDQAKLVELDDETVKRYAPLELGQTLYVDTSEFGEEEYEKLLKGVKDFVSKVKEEK